MFSSFTGSSRRPRVVNLSGQNSNPFANAWSPSNPSGASKTVADAQAERRLRQQDRERLKAAQDIQRVWQGHKMRRILRNSRRQSFDALYAPSGGAFLDHREKTERILLAFPLLLALFEARQDADGVRLELFSRDLDQVGFGPLGRGQLPEARLGRLVQILILACQRSDPAQTPPVLIRLLIEIISSHPRAASPSLGAYYRLLGTYCRFEGAGADADARDLLGKAIFAPLLTHGPFRAEAYDAFLQHFLTQPLGFFEQNIATFGTYLDVGLLADRILSAPLEKPSWRREEGLFWILAHFIAVQAAQPSNSPHPLKALHKLLSILSDDIRLRYPTDGVEETSQSARPADGPAAKDRALPPYVVARLGTLVSRQEISQLLGRFMLDQGPDDASFLAGYLLTLIRCFPTEEDAIRMRLYRSDVEVASQGAPLPAVKLFWNAMCRTTVFTQVIFMPDTVRHFLRRKNLDASSSAAETSLWDREWRTVLLFLDLYAFVLRLTDDEDFLAALQSTTADAPSRVRACALPLDDVKNLTQFLKNLSFTLIEHAADLGPETYSVVPGVGFTAFKDIVSMALRMLYERDSRRPFLPKDHWLMPSQIKMKDFWEAVVLEAERQHELKESGDVSAEEDEEDDYDEMADDQPTFNWGAQRRRRQAWMELHRARQKMTNRDRARASLAPKLEILRQMPYAIPFAERVKIFRQFVQMDKGRRRNGHIDPDQWRMHIIADNGLPTEPNHGARDVLGRHHAKIGRGHLFEDAFDQFYNLGEGLKEPIQITFVDKFGEEEAGIDGGGVTKEFLTSVTSEAFSDENLLFVANQRNAFYPNPLAVDQVRENPARPYSVARLLERFEFLGRVVGKCLYEGILLDIAFAGFFLLKWSTSPTESGYRASINDLRDMDEELYQGLLSLKNSSGDVANLDLDFTINDQVSLPGDRVRTVTRELIPNGGRVRVTNENRPLYTSYVARHRLAGQPYRQTVAFLRGLGTIIDPAWLSMFNQNELQRLVGGDSSDIDVEDLRRNTMYSGIFEIGDDGQEHPTIRLFWKVLREMADSERRDVLKFVTSTPRAPLLGFAQLRPPFSIRDSGGDEDRLPSASTCVNLLKLPRYSKAATLKRKLLYAVSSNAGFDLS